jgi:hypothetical protein
VQDAALGKRIRPTPEVSAAIVRALGIDSAHMVVDSLMLTPWNSQGTAMCRFECVFILKGTPAQVQDFVTEGQPLFLEQW